MPERSARIIHAWLVTGCLLIAAMVTIGGVTRLTGSGLSITEWDVIMGTFPPMTDTAWAELFQKYQAIPQYQELNRHFTLEDFKGIFWWEYFHRLVGRGLGLVFILPFGVFLAKGWLAPALRNRLLLLLALGGFQGVLGWFMVASGLSARTSVSQYRLAAHLITALATFSVTLWTALQLRHAGAVPRPVPAMLRTHVRFFAALLWLQIAYGALVAGLKAGFAYNEFPLMGGQLVPAGAWQLDPLLRNLGDNPATVQFMHRSLAWALMVIGLWLWYTLRVHGLRRESAWLGATLLLQFSLGVVTILRLPLEPVLWGAVHQAGAVLLLTTTLIALFATRPRERS